MNPKKKKHRPRDPEASLGSPPSVPEPETADWESRALSRVRPHVRQLAEDDGEQAAGWETDTLTRLERYFERDEV